MVADVARGVQEWWGPALAFAAGTVSFASPCVLPLVPGYVAFVTGDPGGEAPVGRERTRILPIALFILGFSVVFTVVGGFTATAISRWINSTLVQRISGGIIFAFGLFFILYGLRLGLPWLYREERPLLARVRPGTAGALPLGMAFAIGWTPCVGPVLGAILTLASNQGSTPRTFLLLLLYSLGLGLPFFLVGMGIRRLLGALRFVARNYHWIAGVSGAAMAAIGILLLTDTWTMLLNPIQRMVVRFTPVI